MGIVTGVLEESVATQRGEDGSKVVGDMVSLRDQWDI